MRKTRNFALAAAILVFATGVSLARTASAQPHPPMPPGMPAPPMMGDLHVRIVANAPPARRHEVRSERPGPRHTWINGYWNHSGDAWAWSEGRWAERPHGHAHARWVNARYTHVRGGTRYTPGHWSYERVIYSR